MSIPESSRAPEPRPSTVPRMARVSTGGPGFGPRALILPRARGPWTWMVHPAQMECVGGKIVPRLLKATHEPGAFGNPPGGGGAAGSGHILHLTQQHWIEVPVQVPAIAWGKDRGQQEDILSAYLDDWHGVTDKGRPVVYVTDAWERPKSIGGTTIWQRDQQGFIEWRESLIKSMNLGLGDDGALSDEQITLAVDFLLSAIRSEAVKPGKMSTERVKMLVAHLPERYLTDSIRALIAPSTR